MSPSDSTRPEAARASAGLGGAIVRHARRLVIFVVGGTVALLGIVMFVTPGPGFVVLLVGLSVLGIEFAWARRLMRRAKAAAAWAGQRMKRQNGAGASSAAGGAVGPGTGPGAGPSPEAADEPDAGLRSLPDEPNEAAEPDEAVEPAKRKRCE